MAAWASGIRSAIFCTRAGNACRGKKIPDMKDMGSEAMKGKYEEGPVGYINLIPNGVPNIGKSLGLKG